MNSEWAEPPKDQGKSSLATPGAQLAAQREAMGLSVEHVADQLKLAPRQVVALEAGDYAALPNMAVVRGFVRAYAKVVKLDPAPLVAMIEVVSPTSTEAAPLRKELAAPFSESRFPLMTDRSSGRGGWMLGAAVVVAALIGGGVYAYQSGLISHTLFERGAADSAGASSASAVTELPKPIDSTMPLETTLVKPGQETAPLQSPNVPLISVPPPGGAAPAEAGTGAGSAAPAAATPPAATAPVAAPVATAADAPAASPAAAAGTQLVLEVTTDSWVEIRRPGTKPLISRLVKAGSTETFDIKDPALLIIGKPDGVKATLGGAPLALPPVAGGTISRVNIK
nr:RodZ domain-containing protein [uncultured Duganella sp.]